MCVAGLSDPLGWCQLSHLAADSKLVDWRVKGSAAGLPSCHCFTQLGSPRLRISPEGQMRRAHCANKETEDQPKALDSGLCLPLTRRGQSWEHLLAALTKHLEREGGTRDPKGRPCPWETDGHLSPWGLSCGVVEEAWSGTQLCPPWATLGQPVPCLPSVPPSLPRRAGPTKLQGSSPLRSGPLCFLCGLQPAQG